MFYKNLTLKVTKYHTMSEKNDNVSLSSDSEDDSISDLIIE